MNELTDIRDEAPAFVQEWENAEDECSYEKSCTTTYTIETETVTVESDIPELMDISSESLSSEYSSESDSEGPPPLIRIESDSESDSESDDMPPLENSFDAELDKIIAELNAPIAEYEPLFVDPIVIPENLDDTIDRIFSDYLEKKQETKLENLDARKELDESIAHLKELAESLSSPTVVESIIKPEPIYFEEIVVEIPEAQTAKVFNTDNVLVRIFTPQDLKWNSVPI